MTIIDKDLGTNFLKMAKTIGANLCSKALWSGNRCYWIGDDLAFVNSQWKIVSRAVGPNLYSGTAGAALFLARLFRCAPEQAFKKTAEGAILYSLQQIGQLKANANFGFYSGLTGLAYVLHEMAECLNEQWLMEQSLAIFRDLSLAPADAANWDIFSGSAGIVPVLLKLHCRYGHQFLLDCAVLHGESLLRSANQGVNGWSWSSKKSPAVRDLTGFSHGTAGVAWALFELHWKTGARTFLSGAQEAFRYERHWYSPKWENWPDFRSAMTNGEYSYVAGWCHGAPGIGLSRIRAFQLSGDRDYREEAEIAVRTTTKSLKRALSGSDNYSLCHGHFGNAELLLWAGKAFGMEAHIDTVREIATDAMQKYGAGRNPWPCGLPNAGETPDLMLGLAGIGYFYLRLRDPEKTPSVLLVGPA